VDDDLALQRIPKSSARITYIVDNDAYYTFEALVDPYVVCDFGLATLRRNKEHASKPSDAR
jgi:hypothetical protein